MNGLSRGDRSFAVGAYWYSRRESPSVAADRLSRSFALLRDCGVVFPWELVTAGRDSVVVTDEATRSVDKVAEWLLLGVNRHEFTGEPIEELGLHVAFIVPSEPDSGLLLDVTAGIDAGIDIANFFVLRMAEDCWRSLAVSDVARLVRGIGDIWDVPWSSFYDRAWFFDDVETEQALMGKVMVGAHTFVRRSEIRVELPGAVVERSSEGVFVELPPSVFDCDRSLRAKLKQQLRAQGL